MGYEVGYSGGWSDAISGTYKANKDSKEFIRPPDREMNPWWVYFLPPLIFGYLGFLSTLPSILGIEDESDKEA